MQPITSKTTLLLVLLGSLPLPALAQVYIPPSPPVDPIERMLGAPPLRNPPPSRPVGRSTDDPFQFILARGIHIEHHPNGYDLYAAKAPGIAANCPPDTAHPCGHILWSVHSPPVSGVMYHASVPPQVTLSGAESDILWRPLVHCITHDTRRRVRYKVGEGDVCMNIVDADTQQIEYLVGGQIDGYPPDTPDIYKGWIPVTITMGEQIWDVDVPVTYRLYAPEKACHLEAGNGNITISGLPIEVGVTSPGGNVDIQPTTRTSTALKLTKNFETLCGSDGTDADCPTTITAQTGWVRIMAASSDTWSLDVEAVTLEVTTGSEGHGSDAPWTWHVGYYGGDGRGVRIDTFRSGSISDADSPYFDSGNVAHIFLGGHVDIPDNWRPNRASYSGSAVVALTCS